MHPSDYLKTCRSYLEMTQEELVEALFHFDDKIFAGLTPVTLSRWERQVTFPSIKRMASLLHFFQSRTNLPFPCINN